MDTLFAGALDFIEVRGNTAVFGAKVMAEMTWGDHEEYGPSRLIEGAELVIDVRYWEMLGRPDRMPVGFANEAGWEKWIGAKPEPQVGVWLEANDKKED